MYSIKELWDSVSSSGVPATILLLLMLFVIRWLLLRYIKRKAPLSRALKAKWQVFLKNTILLIAIVGLSLIWAPQLRTFALSLTAVAVAIVIATKELILCVSGSLVRASSSTFTIGDLIEFSGHTGFVIDQSLLTTELQEVDATSLKPSGNKVILPNSLFLTNAVRNISNLNPYSVHSFTLFIDGNNSSAVSKLLAKLNALLEDKWQATLNEPNFKSQSKSKRLLLDSYEPSIRIVTSNTAKIGFVFTITSHKNDTLVLEREISEAFFDLLGGLSSGEIDQIE
ncbi:hypothetical protein NBRC116493_30040 [Aurantivibrio infirmus]